jgi:predicted amidophosphoribosyltransferase
MQVSVDCVQKKAPGREQKDNPEMQLTKEDVLVQDTVAGRRVLLIDDLYGTGATLNAAAEAIMEKGAEAVYVLVLTRKGGQ